jgi:hypothetical protein
LVLFFLIFIFFWLAANVGQASALNWLYGRCLLVMRWPLRPLAGRSNNNIFFNQNHWLIFGVTVLILPFLFFEYFVKVIG